MLKGLTSTSEDVPQVSCRSLAIGSIPLSRNRYSPSAGMGGAGQPGEALVADTLEVLRYVGLVAAPYCPARPIGRAQRPPESRGVDDRQCAVELVRLRDGSRVRVRRVQPCDTALPLDGFARLSAESRWRRFLRPKPELTPAELRYFLGTVRDANGRQIGELVHPTPAS